MEDPYSDIIDKHWNEIAISYHTLKDKMPIIELSLPSLKIYSYPATDYIKGLSLRTRAKTKREYKKACKTNGFLLFVNDEENIRLRTYILDVPVKTD